MAGDLQPCTVNDMKIFLNVLGIVTFFGAVLYSCSKNIRLKTWNIPESADTTTSAQIRASIFKPAIVPKTTRLVQSLDLPSGYRIGVFAELLGKPRVIVVSKEGHVYFSDREKGTVTLLLDKNNDGTADDRQIAASLPDVHGLAIHQDLLYMVTVKEIFRAPLHSNGRLGKIEKIVDMLPDGGQHPNRTLAFGPDGYLFVSVGSTCNACDETNQMSATMLRCRADGSDLTVFAEGLRNTIGFDWHPGTKSLWGADHGIDWLGDDQQKEEINQIQENAHYGWPYIFGKGHYNPGDRPAGDTSYQQFSSMSTSPSFELSAHSAPMQLLFYTGKMFDQKYQQQAFVTLHGSWNRRRPSGYSVVSIKFQNGEPVSSEPFLTGFLTNGNKSCFGRPCGLAQLPDGSLLVGDDANGIIYRIYK